MSAHEGSAMRNPVAVELLEKHVIFTNAAIRIMAVISSSGPLSLDEVVVLSRTPIRTALLTLDHLEFANKVRFDSGLVVSQQTHKTRKSTVGGSKAVLSGELTPLETRYMELAKVREVPCLVWGQRRLNPDSALDRARHIVSVASSGSDDGVVVFLGDDDLVSPIVAATTGWRTVVIDIDLGVLATAQRVASQLGAEIEVRHADLAAGSLGLGAVADIVVADPFPSGDGSFESVFWAQGARLLRPEGFLVTTVAPSHKPHDYALGALDALTKTGFYTVDLKADFGRYEVFDFEFVEFERALVQRFGGACSIAHTKSLLTGRMHGRPRGTTSSEDFDFSNWTAAAVSHYLTQQAGADEQIRIADDRGVYRVHDAGLGPPAKGSSAARPVGSDEKSARKGQPPTQVHAAPLVERATAIGAPADSHVGLVLRAIESWERWRLDG
jgi:predicted methyltransferase